MNTTRPLLALAVLAALAGCNRPPAASTGTATPAAPAANAPVQRHAAISGIDKAGMDTSATPGDDFYAYANGNWQKATEIPADRASTSAFYEMFKRAEQRTSDLIKGLDATRPAAGSNAAKIADYYAAYMDESGIEQRGLAPLQAQLDAIDAIKTPADLAHALGEQLRADVDPINATNFSTEHLFGLFVAQGLEDPSHNIGYLLQGGLGMPDRDYYLSGDKDMADARTAYQAYVAALLKQAGTADADARAKEIVALETKIAQAHASVVDSQDIHKANHVWALSDFAKKAPGLDWAAFFKAAQLDGQPSLDAWQPDAIRKLSALTTQAPLQAWKDWLRFHAINHVSAVLPKAYADLGFGFYGKTLQGTPQQQDRWKRAVAATSNALGDAVGQLYVKQYFPASSRERVQKMVDNIVAAFGQHVDALDWMTPQTKQKAKEKIAALKVSVGYPDAWRDYGGLEVKRDDALGNAQRAERFEYEHQLSKLGKPVDRAEWWMTPQTVNAINLPLQNALNFPAAILEKPFFDPDAEDAANYGAIGAVIGHEISHSFDSLGADFDAQGRLSNWWTKEDKAHFDAAGDRLAKQFDAYEALPGLHLNGRQELGENIADVSGLAISLAAYHAALGGKPSPTIDGLTGDQRFFLAFAQAWRQKTRDAALRQQVVTDVHAPAQFRARTVRNQDAWYDAFDVKPGQQLYLDPKDRVKIW